MLPEQVTQARHRRWLGISMAVWLPVCLGGCYLTGVSAGHLALMADRQPIEAIVADAATDAGLRERLQYVREVRSFASYALALPDNGSFTTYVALDRPYVAWNVFAAPEFSTEPRRWCFLVAGCVSYRGYFAERQAVEYARQLAARGWDVHVSPVAAYSTLGHFDDPVLSSVLGYGDVELAGLVFHELAHQVAYVPGDSAFNEAFATAVEIEGVKRWLDGLGRYEDLVDFLEGRRRLLEVAGLMGETRQRLVSLYAAGDSTEALRAAKADEFARMQAAYQAMSSSWNRGPTYRGLVMGEFNNARLAAAATYHECLPGFQRLLGELDGYLQGFYRAVRRLGRLTAEERRRVVCIS
ncbi:MAG: aminopeptidase [Steroidobacteraceae bacterium]